MQIAISADLRGAGPKTHVRIEAPDAVRLLIGTGNPYEPEALIEIVCDTDAINTIVSHLRLAQELMSAPMGGALAILPCPFCGSTDIVTHNNDGNGRYWVYCRNCDASGSDARTEAEAAEKWNSAIR